MTIISYYFLAVPTDTLTEEFHCTDQKKFTFIYIFCPFVFLMPHGTWMSLLIAFTIIADFV